MKRVYLAGAIFGLADRGQTWREQIIPMLPTDWEAVNPNTVELDKVNPKDLVEGDYETIRGCQAIIARIRNPSWGTAMELAFAKSINVPVIGFPFLRPPLPWAYSPWLIHHVAFYAQSLEHAVSELANVQ
jgi:nucleoside 2-deoxyribosyltransferase